jgi:hypothetical protein
MGLGDFTREPEYLKALEESVAAWKRASREFLSRVITN